jgi:hypothetical protein
MAGIPIAPLLPLEFKENSPKAHFNMEVKNLMLRKNKVLINFLDFM